MKKLLTTTLLALLPLAATAAELKPSTPASVTTASVIVAAPTTAAQLPQAADYSMFLRKDVPVDVQRAALRMLWSTQPTAPAESGGGAF